MLQLHQSNFRSQRQATVFYLVKLIVAKKIAAPDLILEILNECDYSYFVFIAKIKVHL